MVGRTSVIDLRAAFLMLLQAASGEIVLRESNGVAYEKTDIEAGCGTSQIRIQYRNDWPRGERGRVIFVRIDGQEVAGAAAGLQERAANRTITDIDIMNCGDDRENPTFQGVMELARLESRQRGMPPAIFFRIWRAGGTWQIFWE